MMDDILRIFRHVFRSLRRSPGFTAAAVVSLALGIGLTAALFSVADAILFKPFLKVREPERLVSLYSRSGQGDYSSVSYADYRDYRSDSETFEDLMAYIRLPMSFNAGGRTELIWGEQVTANYFDVLGAALTLGRGFRSGEDRPGAAAPMVVISHALWNRAFAGDRDVLGRTVRIYDRSFTVIGVAPRGFRGVTLDWGEPPQIWLPIGWFDDFVPNIMRRRILESREARTALVVGRLRPDVTFETAQAALRVRASQLSAAHPEDRGWTVEVLPGREARFWPTYRRSVVSFLGLLGTTCVFILLLACANVANLQLARGAAREQEIAVRLALGASRRRIISELLAESGVIAVFGFAAGLAVARGGMMLISTFPLPFEVPLHFELTGLHPRVLFLAAAVSVLATVFSGLFPALATSRIDLRASLQTQAGSSGTSLRHSRLRAGLVVSEVALALLLLAGAGLFLRTLGRAASVDLGFKLDNVYALTLNFNVRHPQYDDARVTAFCRRAIDRIRPIVGIESAAWAGDAPLMRRRLLIWFVKEGTPVHSDGDWSRTDCNLTSPGYFDALGIRLVRGRDFTERDDESAPRS